MLINVKPKEKKEMVSSVCERNTRERRRVGERRTERERGWANKGNKERMRLMAEKLAQCHPFSGSTKAYFPSFSRVAGETQSGRREEPATNWSRQRLWDFFYRLISRFIQPWVGASEISKSSTHQLIHHNFTPLDDKGTSTDEDIRMKTTCNPVEGAANQVDTRSRLAPWRKYKIPSILQHSQTVYFWRSETGSNEGGNLSQQYKSWTEEVEILRHNSRNFALFCCSFDDGGVVVVVAQKEAPPTRSIQHSL